MLASIIVCLVTYLLTSLLGYFVHWAIHRPWAGPLYRAHRAHHIDLYPPGKLISDEYKSAGSKSSVYTFLLAFSPLLLLPVVLCLTGVFSVWMMVSSIVAMATVGFLNDFVHDSFHVKEHWLGRILPGYERLRRLHFVHHVNMKKNYGIYSFVWDRVFRTLRQ